MRVSKTNIDGVLIFDPLIHGDNRGYFFESFKIDIIKKYIPEFKFVQENESKSSFGVLRGFHFQKPPFEQAKLVRCISGRILDIAVDLRKNSSTFGKYEKIILSGKNKKQFFVPRGFAHAFLVLSKIAIVSYKVDNIYAPDYDSGIVYNDNSLNINWGINESQLIISEKDMKLKTISETLIPF